MASLVDQALVRAVQEAQAPQRQAVARLTDTIGGAVGGIGSSLARRGVDVRDMRSKLEAYKKALDLEKSGLESERERLASQVGPLMPYQQAEHGAMVRSLDKRIGEVGRTSEQLPDIGDVNFRNVYRQNFAQLPERQDIAPDAAYKDIQLSTQQQRMQDEQERRAARQRIEDARYEREFKQRQEKIDADRATKEEARKQKMSILPPKQQKTVDAADSTLDTLQVLTREVETNKELLPYATPAFSEYMKQKREGTWQGEFSAWLTRKGAKNFPPETDFAAVESLMSAVQTVSGPQIKELYGAVLTPQELAKAERNTINPGDSYETIKTKVNNLIELAESGRERAIKQAEGAGYITDSYQRDKTPRLGESTPIDSGLPSLRDLLKQGGAVEQ